MYFYMISERIHDFMNIMRRLELNIHYTLFFELDDELQFETTEEFENNDHRHAEIIVQDYSQEIVYDVLASFVDHHEGLKSDYDKAEIVLKNLFKTLDKQSEV